MRLSWFTAGYQDAIAEFTGFDVNRLSAADYAEYMRGVVCGLAYRRALLG